MGATLLDVLLVLAYFLIGSAIIIFLFWWALTRLCRPKSAGLPQGGGSGKWKVAGREAESWTADEQGIDAD